MAEEHLQAERVSSVSKELHREKARLNIWRWHRLSGQSVL